MKIVKIVMILISACYAVFSNSIAQAAYADIYVDGSCYNMAYSGRLAGFACGNLSGTPILYMSTDPTIYTPVVPGTPVNLYTYADVQAGASGLKWTATQYNEMAWVLDGYTILDNSAVPNGWKQLNSANRNIAINNLAVSGSVPFPNASSSLYNSGQAESLYNSALQEENFDWSTIGLTLFSVPGGDEFFSTQAVRFAPRMTATPIPPASWLFLSGLVGITGIARRVKI
ncbi:MAG: hypothetical protein ACYC8S_03860 [Minisyncoccota bacterium]